MYTAMLGQKTKLAKKRKDIISHTVVVHDLYCWPGRGKFKKVLHAESPQCLYVQTTK